MSGQRSGRVPQFSQARAGETSAGQLGQSFCSLTAHTAFPLAAVSSCSRVSQTGIVTGAVKVRNRGKPWKNCRNESGRSPRQRGTQGARSRKQRGQESRTSQPCLANTGDAAISNSDGCLHMPATQPQDSDVCIAWLRMSHEVQKTSKHS